ncbi:MULTISPECIES: YlbF family regulator [Bacillus]|uniref:YlbF family regulator n=1 Tax=Bacillus TaxID=1386 RepID=UPI000BB6984E|nr:MULTISPECIES: YlbF family regulator [Bacillus]
MIATLERLQLVEGAEQLAKMVLQSDIYEDYLRCLYNLRTNKEAMEIVSKFVAIKEKHEEVQRFGKYHPDYRLITKETRDIKRTLDLNETVATFKEAENAIQKLLDEISVLLGRAVSEHIKVPTGNPFFDSMSSCGGGCGSGGSCGCG